MLFSAHFLPSVHPCQLHLSIATKLGNTLKTLPMGQEIELPIKLTTERKSWKPAHVHATKNPVSKYEERDVILINLLDMLQSVTKKI